MFKTVCRDIYIVHVVARSTSKNTLSLFMSGEGVVTRWNVRKQSLNLYIGITSKESKYGTFWKNESLCKRVYIFLLFQLHHLNLKGLKGQFWKQIQLTSWMSTCPFLSFLTWPDVYMNSVITVNCLSDCAFVLNLMIKGFLHFWNFKTGCTYNLWNCSLHYICSGKTQFTHS